MRLIYSTCDYCGGGTHAIHFDGGGYCCLECARKAELARRSAGKAERVRHDAARARQADQQMHLRVGLALLGLCVAVICSGCETPGDHYGPDERAHVAAGHSVAGGGL
ncbi:hypothetical protein [Armatimonas sp.]|uniref:hypothetical protein n=1 Tax=Armatimonas sp. TaxID=1872638 RepID=UPI0037510D73